MKLRIGMQSANGELWYELDAEGAPCTDRVYGAVHATEEGAEQFAEMVREYVYRKAVHENEVE